MQFKPQLQGFAKFSVLITGLLLGICLTVSFSALAEKMVKSQLPIEDLRAFAEVFGKIKTDYVEDVEDEDLLEEAINGMLTGLDPHSTYMGPDAFKDMQASTQGEFGGLGIEVAIKDGLIEVVAPIEDSPAYKAGLKAGDLISKLNDTFVKGMTLTEAVKIMRGKPGTTINLTVLREGNKSPLPFTITRDTIKSKSVKSKLIEPDYAYVRITQFQEHTGPDLAKAIRKLYEENHNTPFKGFVLDLRNDPGGLLNSAVGVSAAFLPKDALVVYTEGRAPDSKMRLTVDPTNYAKGGRQGDYMNSLPTFMKTVPMAVIINAGSASASEIVAGALQDHKRAKIFGVKSFGKGSVQTIMPMNNGAAIKLTTARYFTPNGRSIQAKGIEPDFLVEDGSDQSHRIHEKDLSGHLSNPKDAAKTKPKKPTLDKAESRAKVHKKRFSETKGPVKLTSEDDIQFVETLNYLKGKPMGKTVVQKAIKKAKKTTE